MPFHVTVQGVNTKKLDQTALLLLEELSNNQELTQRDLSDRLGIALGLINSYLKNLASKGFITVSGIPRKRYTYYLTPKGFAEKARLTYQHLQNLTALYKIARRDYSLLFTALGKSGIRRVAFCGVDEITEIAYLSLKETQLELVAVADQEPAGRSFFGLRVLSIGELSAAECDRIIITSFQKGEELKGALMVSGADEGRITGINTAGWLKRIDESRHKGD